MEEDSDAEKDLNNSLVDLHYGLDSSIEEPPPVVRGNSAHNGVPTDKLSHDVTKKKDVQDDQMAMIHEMVVEMKQSFQSALLQLAQLQGKDVKHDEEEEEEKRQQRQTVEGLVESVNKVKTELLSLRSSVSVLQDEQRAMYEQQTLMWNRQQELLAITRTQNMLFSSKPGRSLPRDVDRHRKLMLSSLGARSRDLQSPASDVSAENDIKAAACKSLSLTQSLGRKFSSLRLNESSDEERLDHDDAHTTTNDEGSDRLTFLPASQFFSSSGQNSPAFDEAVNRRQSLPASFGKGSKWQTVSQDVLSAVQRRRAMKELADSEHSYCSTLWCLLHLYTPSLHAAGCFTQEELGVLVPAYLDTIYTEHSRLATHLQERLIHWTSDSSVSDLLMGVAESDTENSLLSLYSTYAENLPAAALCLRQNVNSSPDIQHLLKTIRQSSCLEEDFFTLLIAPVQHVPKFMLHLQQVLRWTPVGHPDWPVLDSCLRALRASVDQLNQFIIQAMQTWTEGGETPRSKEEDIQPHSSIAEEESITSARDLYKPRPSEMPQEWFELDSTESQDTSSDGPPVPPAWLPDTLTLYQSEKASSTWRHNTRSQPNLARLSYSMFTTDLHQSADRESVSPNISAGSSVDERGHAGSNSQVKVMQRQDRHYPKYKVTKQHMFSVSDARHNPTDQRRWRPVSAVDFSQHKHRRDSSGNNSSLSDGPNLSPSVRQRPQSALASSTNSRSQPHRPMIISRMQNARPHSAMSSPRHMMSPSSFGASGAALALSRDSKSMSTNELLPQYPAHVLGRGEPGEDDASDDTCASESSPLVTSDGHKHSRDGSTNNSHNSENNHQEKRLNNSNNTLEMIRKNRQQLDGYLTGAARLTKNSQNQNGSRQHVIKRNDGAANTSRLDSVINKVIEKSRNSWKEGEGDMTVTSSHSPHKHNPRVCVSPASRQGSSSPDFQSATSSLTVSPAANDLVHSRNPQQSPSSFAASEQLLQLENSPRHCRSPVVEVSQSERQNGTNPELSALTQDSSLRGSNTKHLVENNRQFLMSLTSKSQPHNGGVSPRSYKSPKSEELIKNESENTMNQTNNYLNFNGNSVISSTSSSSNSVQNETDKNSPSQIANNTQSNIDNKHNSQNRETINNSLSRGKEKPYRPNSEVGNTSMPSNHNKVFQVNDQLRSTLDTSTFSQTVNVKTSSEYPSLSHTIPKVSSKAGKSNRNSRELCDKDAIGDALITHHSASGGGEEKEKGSKTTEDSVAQQLPDPVLGASDEHVAARKKTHFKASIKNLFKKKKFTESDV